MNKKIMILGGAAAQVPLIRAAKNEGYYVVLCDWTTTNPGIDLADIHYQVSILDYTAIKEIAEIEKINGIISNYEAAMTVVARISEEFGLIGNPCKSIEILKGKNSFRKLQKELGLFCPKSIEISCLDEFYLMINHLDFSNSIVIKPSECSASKGTSIVNLQDKIEVEKAIINCFSISRNQKVTVEEFVPCSRDEKLIGGDIVVADGKIFWNGLGYGIRSNAFPQLPCGKSFPLDLSERRLSEIKETISKIFSSLSLYSGEYNIEAYYTSDDKLFIIEINVRQGGNQIPLLIKDSTGFDMNKMLVTSVMGDYEYFETATKESCSDTIASYVVFTKASGIYRGLHIASDIADNVYDVTENVKPGDYVKETESAVDALALVKMKFSNPSILRKKVKFFAQYIYPIIDSV